MADLDIAAFLRARFDDEQAELDTYLRDPYEGASDDERHQRHAHPAYEYRTLEGQRKAWPYVDDPPEGEGWELNTTSVDPDAFERFDYTEERYWRRLRPEGPSEWTPSPRYARRATDVESKRQIIELCATETNETGGRPLAIRTLRLLALPYADHPEFREEWK